MSVLTLNSNSFSQVKDLALHENSAHAFFDLVLIKQVIQDIYDKYLSTPFDDTRDTVYQFDWIYQTSEGLVHRPNHGLAHTLRGVMMVPEVVKQYAEHHKNDQFKKLNATDIFKMQLAMVFAVVGRRSEIEFNQNPSVFMEYRQSCADIFEAYVHTHLSDIFSSPAELSVYKELVRNYGDPLNSDPRAKIMHKCHCLDLIRCTTAKQFQNKLVYQLQNDIGADAAQTLIDYAKNQLLATGDRVLALLPQHSRKDALFYACSTSVEACAAALLSVQAPSQQIKTLKAKL